MISTRGPKSVMVVDRNAVPISEICSALIYKDTITEIQEKYPVTKEEIEACIKLFCDTFGPIANQEFIEIECTNYDGDLEVETVGLSDWVYLQALKLGYEINSDIDDLTVMFATGLEKIMFESLTGVFTGSEAFLESPMHKLVFESFERSYGKVGFDEAELLLHTLNFDPPEGMNGL